MKKIKGNKELLIRLHKAQYNEVLYYARFCYMTHSKDLWPSQNRNT